MKKFVTFICMALLLVLLCSHTIAAEIPTLEVSQASGKPGETVEIKVSIKNNPGFGGMTYDVGYDSSSLKLLSYSTELGKSVCTDSGVSGFPNKVKFIYAALSNVKGDGVLVTLKFKILTSTLGNVAVTVTPEKGSTFTYGGSNGRQEIDFTLSSTQGFVSVLSVHDNTIDVPEIPAECNKPGYTAGVYCNHCNTYISGHEEIPATGKHVDADGKWEKDANSHYHTCKCGKILDKASHSGKATCKEKAICTVCLTEFGTPDSSAHILVKTSKNPATHESSGNIEYYTCSYCTKIFSDSSAKNEITLADTVLEKIEHTYFAKSDVTHHWKECSCGSVIEKSEHVFTGNTCSCGYTKKDTSSETQPPVVTTQPVVTTEPVTTPEPETTPVPVTTPEPETTPAPVTTPEPVTTPTPVTTPEPITTPTPVTTPEPITTPTPVTTPEPVTTPAPVTTPTETTPIPETTPVLGTSETTDTPTSPAASTTANNTSDGENDMTTIIIIAAAAGAVVLIVIVVAVKAGKKTK